MDITSTFGRYEGYFDPVSDDVIRVWAWCSDQPNEILNIELRVNGQSVGCYKAGEFRPDLLGAGKGDGNHGLTVDLKSILDRYDPSEMIEIEAYNAGDPNLKFASLRFRRSSTSSYVVPPLMAVKFRELFEAPAIRTHREAQRFEPASAPMSLEDRRARVLIEDSNEVASTKSRSNLTKYAEFTRQRFRVADRFQTDLTKTDIDHFLKWYLEFYCVNRGELRAPLSAKDIAYLNEDIVLGGQEFHLTRATWTFLIDNKALISGADLNSADYYLSAVYWWCIERARSLFVEDCLVTAGYRASLNEIRHELRLQEFPLNRFLEFFFNRNIQFHFLNLDILSHRVLLYIAVMLNAIEHPSLIQYLPRQWYQRLLNARDKEQAIFSQACCEIFGDSPHSHHVADYARAMKLRGFDIETQKSLAISRDGHRIYSATFKPLDLQAALPEELGVVDVQIIGPLQKASGLGQAARLSAEALMKTEVSTSFFNFDLDNPAPEILTDRLSLSSLRSARVNLIHLNAESLPLAIAYNPDVFSTSYNIGYFFWELDTPAKCHRLALELLDEIWVSSQYCVDIYQNQAKCPVINVGMPYQDVTVPDRSAARRLLQSRLGIAPEQFTFLAAFDSFSFIQRKNPHGVVKAFLEAFPQGDDKRLILKTHNKDFVSDPTQVRIWRYLTEAANADPRITIFNETLNYEELIALKAGVDCYVSLHKSEGLGFGMLEAMHLGVPVMATNYSGNLEFCRDDTAWLVDYRLTPLAPEDYIFVAPGQQWAEPIQTDAAAKMRLIYENTTERNLKAAAAQAFVREAFSTDAIGRRYAERLSKILLERRKNISSRRKTNRISRKLG